MVGKNPKTVQDQNCPRMDQKESARRSLEKPGREAMKSQEELGRVKRSHKTPQEKPGRARGAQDLENLGPWAVGGDTSYIALSLKTPRFRRCKRSQQGGAKQSHAKPEKGRKSQRVTEEPRIRQKQPGGAMRSQVRPGRARRFVRERGSGDF